MMVEECVKFMFMIWNLLLSLNSSSLVIFYSRYTLELRITVFAFIFIPSHPTLLYLSIQLIPSYSLIFIHPAHPILSYSLIFILFIRSSHPILLSYIYPSSSSHHTLFLFIHPAYPILLFFIYPFYSSHSPLLYLSVPFMPSYSLIFIHPAHPILLSYILLYCWNLGEDYTTRIYDRIILLESRRELYC